MIVPINKKEYEVFISESKIFKKTYDLMVKCLSSWYDDDKEQFINDMWTDFDTVMNTYRFENEGVSNENFDIDEFKNMLKTEGYNVELRDTLYKENSVSTGWKLVNGKYYYFSFSGALAKDEIVDGYYLGTDGALVTTKGKSQLQDFTMNTEKSIYPLSTESIKINITNNTNLDSSYGGMYYQIDKFENNEWHNLDFSKDFGFGEISICLPAKETNTEIYKLSILKDFKKLTPGKYRILAEIGNSIGYSHVIAEFELQ